MWKKVMALKDSAEIKAIQKRLWILENPEKFKFNQELIYFRPESMSGHPSLTKICVYKGVYEVNDKYSVLYQRFCFVEYDNDLHIVRESELRIKE